MKSDEEHAKQFLPFVHDDKLPNRYSSTITRGSEFPGSQAMLYAAGVPNKEDLTTKPQIGVGSVWWEGNPCNTHLHDLGVEVKKAVSKAGMIPWQYGTIGVSDAITMGNNDSFETITCGQWHDGVIAIPGCDKNMPGVLMAMARYNRPSIMIYGGTIKPGHSSKMPGEDLNIGSCFEAYGKHLNGKMSDDIFDEITRHACPGAGACGGLFTANTMSTAAEAMGMSLPGSSSAPAVSPEKWRECARSGEAIKILVERNIKPRDIMTREAFHNALVMTMALGGSTNACLHYLAIAHSASVPLELDDFQRVADKIPFIANLKPSGKFLMNDLFEIGGVPAVMKLLLAAGFLNGNIMTVTGNTLADNLKSAPSLPQDQAVIRPLSNPIKSTGHITILRGNLAPAGAVAKITGKEGLSFTGKARVFEREEDLITALSSGTFKKGENVVICVRYEGPRGGPGMPEQLKASGALMGADLGDCVALITDGRYSGASHGFIVGHMCPEACDGGPVAVLRDGDSVAIDAVNRTINMAVSDDEISERFKSWKKPAIKVTRGTLAKYARLVTDASHGAVTDLF